MKNYYVILDFTNVAKQNTESDFSDKMNYLFRKKVPVNVSLTVNDKGLFNSVLSDDSLKNTVSSCSSSYSTFYKNLDLGSPLTVKEINIINSYVSKVLRNKFGIVSESNNLFCLFDLDFTDKVMISSEFLVDYFLETFEDFDAEIIKKLKTPGYKFPLGGKILFLARVELDEDIVNNLKNIDSDYLVENLEILKYKEMREMLSVKGICL